MKQKNSEIYYKRNLPHYQPMGYTFFVTFRLAGSLPVDVVKKLKLDREKELQIISSIINNKLRTEKYYEYQKKYFAIFDNLLESCKSSPKWLMDENIAKITQEAIHYRDKSEYELIAYTIMPNHVHLVFTPITIIDHDVIKSTRNSVSSYNAIQFAESQDPELHNSQNSNSNFIVTKILHELKKHTALESNIILGRQGTFWQHESYDHVVRNIAELRRIVNYILKNPVKAGLVIKQEDWKWSYCNPKYLV
ncbi:MAG: hypothetical protein KKF62_04085 [Bacteroidetes bacterium]|nr:hypothetical protein [Bacteroidota bacterium]MBU1116376.1 hypothetical protein [Bacteroidota bacterium]MBU1800400.1 hypothetical protein [Bacteroidota bacterium]